MSGMRRAFTEALAFGRSNSPKGHSKVEKRLADCLPAADWAVYDDHGELKGFSGWHVFGSQTARNHFIKHALILLSDNGRNDLSTLHFDNFFARSYDKAGVIWYTASIVATAPGDYRIRHSIVATRAGTTKTAAFQLLMLDVETKLDAVLRGNGINSGGLPAREGRRKDSVGTVSIISTPSEAMAAPKVKADDCDTWSGAPLAASLKSKASTQFSSASIASQGTQTSSASSQYSQTSHFPDTTEASAQVSQGPSNVSCKPAQPSKTWAAPSYSLHARHVSTPLHTVPSAALQTLKVPRHLSQQMPPRSASTPPTATKQLPALPHAFTDQAFSRPEPSKIHPPLRSTHSSTECLNPVSPYHEAVTTGSSLYSLSPVSPIDGGEKKMQPLHVDADMPSPLHFEKPIARMPARLLRQQTEFKIYVGEEV